MQIQYTKKGLEVYNNAILDSLQRKSTKAFEMQFESSGQPRRVEVTIVDFKMHSGVYTFRREEEQSSKKDNTNNLSAAPVRAEFKSDDPESITIRMELFEK